MALTRTQARFLAELRNFVELHGHTPTLAEMKEHLEATGWGEIRSLNSIAQFFRALEAAGEISRERGKRGVRLADPAAKSTGVLSADFWEIPLLASPVACGAPTRLIEEESDERVRVSRTLLRNPERVYALRCSGDSMDLAGIADGDLILVESTPEVRDGQLVLASLDGAGTVKKLRRAGETVALLPQSSNPIHQPIYLHESDDAVIAGRVVAVLPR